MAFRELVVEAVKKTTVIATKVANNLSLAEFKNISRMKEMDKNYISDLASFHSIHFDDLKDNEKEEVIEKIWNKVKSGETSAELEETPDNKPLSKSELKQQIMDYVKAHGAVLYPLESAAEDLASALTSEEKPEEETKEEKCPCCGKSPCECGPDCECGCHKDEEVKEGIGDTIRKIGDQTIQSLKDLPETSMPVTEAVMNDIPHEIDDQIHTLKDMRFELEQTKKNWDIAGVETQPMDEVLSNIDGLIASLYQNGAKMADDEISKGQSEVQEPEKEEE